MRVLIIAPHADDEVLGTGGVIQWHKARGDVVYVVIVSNRVLGHKIDEEYIKQTKRSAEEVKRLLGVEQFLFCDLFDEHLDKSLINVIVPTEDMINIVKPDKVYIPNENDNNQDHRAVNEACRVVCKNIDKILMYEIPSSTPYFKPNFYVEITEEYLGNKIKAMSFYESEFRKYPNPRSPEGLRVFAQMRGMESNRNLAEAFVLIKGVI